MTEYKVSVLFYRYQKGKMSNELEKFLIEYKIEVTPSALKKLDEEFGVTKLEHLDFIEQEDLKEAGICTEE